MSQTTSSPGNERRNNPELRPVFEQAYEVIRPFFSDTTNWSAGQGHQSMAFYALRTALPDLSAQQAQIIVAAAQRVFANGGCIAPA